MSSLDIASGQIKFLTPEEWQVLRALERSSAERTSTSARMVSRMSGQPEDRVSFALSRLNARGLATMGRNHTVRGAGLDILALKYYVDNCGVAALGKIIARGKESDVYEVVTDGGDLLALKIFRIGRQSFREVRRKRGKGTSGLQSWLVRNYRAAKDEFTALKRLEGLTESIPRVVSYNRHTVLLEELLGVRLSERPELVSPSSIFRSVMETVRRARLERGVINADLSEYNILTDGGRAWIIDWPQWVRTDHPNAAELTARDVDAVVRFFGRAYGVSADPAKALAYATGAAPRLRIGVSSSRGSAS